MIDVREGRAQGLQGHFPQEIQPLTDDFNRVLERHADMLERARHHAGNLAHAVKTPLAVLAQAAAQAPSNPLAPLVLEQVQLATRHIDWHLARARTANQDTLIPDLQVIEARLAALLENAAVQPVADS